MGKPRSQQAERPENPSETAEREDIDYRLALPKQDQAVREVEIIAKLFVKGDDPKARKFRDQLVARQEEEADQSFLVKSLCNIASKCSTGGRRDIAAECLRQALNYPQGVDFLLHVQMGNLFKDLSNYDQASECFKRAENLAPNDGERNKVGRELARLLTARGDYAEALAAFKRLPDIQDSPASRTSMATVLRKMGRVDEARWEFDTVYSTDRRHHQAFAGLAEINRQNGRYQKAIKKYGQLVDLRNLDERPLKVYRSALSSLFSLVGKRSKAFEILNELLADAPHDPNLQLSMAKLLRLQGQSAEADELYRKSLAYLDQIELLAAHLYATALGEFSSAEVARDRPVLPELQGLERCNHSLRLIVDGKVDVVLDQPPVFHVFRLHRDFESVLRYHARRATVPTSSLVSDISVNRLRKRGLKELQDAVRSI